MGREKFWLIYLDEVDTGILRKDIYPDSLLLGGSGRVAGTQALRVIAVTALIAL